MKKIYGYILGREAKLSVAEIEAVYRGNNCPYRILFYQNDILIIESDEDFFDLLGGSVKLFEVKLTNQVLNAAGLKGLIDVGGKVVFGISMYGQNAKKNIVIELGKKIKVEFKEEKINSRFLYPKNTSLSSVEIDKNKVIKKGGEIIIVQDGPSNFIGKTLKVQDFETYSKMDYGRPASDAFSGMMPPKLCQMMINLSGIKPDKNIKFLDPFCGSGTMLMMAAYLGYNNIYGSDISAKAVEASLKNLDWYKNEFDKDFSCQIEEKDVLSFEDDGGFDLVVTEGYLGRPKNQKTTQGEIEKEISELKDF